MTDEATITRITSSEPRSIELKGVGTITLLISYKSSPAAPVEGIVSYSDPELRPFPTTLADLVGEMDVVVREGSSDPVQDQAMAYAAWAEKSADPADPLYEPDVQVQHDVETIDAGAYLQTTRNSLWHTLDARFRLHDFAEFGRRWAAENYWRTGPKEVHAREVSPKESTRRAALLASLADRSLRPDGFDREALEHVGRGGWGLDDDE
jgi:hypothetical protein